MEKGNDNNSAIKIFKKVFFPSFEQPLLSGISDDYLIKRWCLLHNKKEPPHLNNNKLSKQIEKKEQEIIEKASQEIVEKEFEGLYYLTYNDFINNFNNNFKKYKEVYKEADVIDFKEYYVNNVYGYLFDKTDIDNTLCTIKRNGTKHRLAMTSVIHIPQDEDGYSLSNKKDYVYYFIAKREHEIDIHESSLKDCDFYTNLALLLPFFDGIEKNTFNYVKLESFKHSLRKIAKYLTAKEDGKTEIKKQSEIADINLSDTKGTEKIIMLEKTGVLDFLRKQTPFNLSVNSLASLLSGITGMPQATVQSYLNPICNHSVDQSKNPFKSTKTVNKVVEKFNSIGYKPLK